jgi:hypothetical protein
MEKDGVKPKKVHYTTVIDTSGDPKRAFELVKKITSMMTRMDGESQNVLRPFFRTEDCETAPPPTMAAYAVTLTVWANSTRRAWQVLERMRSETEQF